MVDKFVGFVKLPAAPMAPSQNSDVSSNGGTTSSSDRNGAQEVANNSEKISMVACGAEHMVVLTRSGAVYAVGANDEGQLGTGDPKERAAKQRANEKPASKYTSSFSNSRRVTAETEPTDPAPTRVAFFLQQSVIVTWIAAGGNATAALGMCFSPTGSLFDDSPKKTSQQTRRKASSKAEPPRTPRSQLWTWGSNAAGQLGCGRVEVKRQWEPGTVSIDGGPNTRVISVAMGEDHAVALVTEELENLAEESNSVEFKEDEESEDESEQEGEGGKSKEGGEDQETSSKSADWHRRRRAREPAEAAAASEKHAAEAARAAGGSESSSEDPFVKRSNGVVQGRVLTWGRSAAGRLGVGDPEK
jgi:alpha-tubulin suppressor-like RCC1 family protein